MKPFISVLPEFICTDIVYYFSTGIYLYYAWTFLYCWNVFVLANIYFLTTGIYLFRRKAMGGNNKRNFYFHGGWLASIFPLASIVRAGDMTCRPGNATQRAHFNDCHRRGGEAQSKEEINATRAVHGSLQCARWVGLLRLPWGCKEHGQDENNLPMKSASQTPLNNKLRLLFPSMAVDQEPK